MTERRRSTKKAKRISNEDNGATEMLQIRGGSVVSVDGGGGGAVAPPVLRLVRGAMEYCITFNRYLTQHHT